MKNIFIGTCLALLSSISQAAVVTETFENVGDYFRPSSVGDIKNVDQFGSWFIQPSTFESYILDTSSGTIPSGFTGNLASGTNLLFSTDLTLTTLPGRGYELESLTLGSAWMNSLQVHVIASRLIAPEVSIVWRKLFVLDAGSPMIVEFDDYTTANSSLTGSRSGLQQSQDLYNALLGTPVIAEALRIGSVNSVTGIAYNSNYLDFFDAPRYHFTVDNFTYNNTSIAVVPEPSTYAMLGIGLALLGFAARRNK